MIRRIFRDYRRGVSPKADREAAESLSACLAPVGAPWNPSTIHGNPARGTGILNNELYVGRLVWNRLRYVKDPDTGKRVSRPNPPSEWVTTDVPDLRIVDDELWNEVKARQAAMRRRHVKRRSGAIQSREATEVPVLGADEMRRVRRRVVIYWHDRLAASARATRGTLHNRLTISREEVEERVLVALRDKLMRQDLFEEFCASSRAR